jgi:hypothetical protein
VLTSYQVSCPHTGCDWYGSLLPSGGAEAWRRASPTVKMVTFQCPLCHGEWHARVVGDDVEALPLDEVVAQATYS